MSRIVNQGNETNTDGQMDELISPPSSAGPAYTLPGEAWLSSATLSQDGFDLVLTLDGATYRVGDYFSFQTPPNLVLETGPSLTPAMVKSLLPRAFASDYLYAGPAAGPGLGEPIGTVSLLAGTATVRRADGSTEALSRGDPIYRGDVLLTGDGSFVKIRFTDGTTFQLGKNGEAALDDFEFNEAANIGNFEASIRVGGFYYKSGKIGEVTEGSADAHTKLSTPSSIISVRGSELEGTVDSSGQTSVIHRSGILVVTDQNGNNAVTLDQPGATAVVAQGGAPAFYAQAPAAVIQQIQASVQPQTGDEDVAPEESADEAQEEQTEEEASEEEAAEESEEEAEEEVTEEAVEEESEEEETEEDVEEDSEEEASDSEEADEDAAEDETEAETATEAEEEAAEEEIAGESEAEADDEAAQEEEAAEDSAEDEASEESTEESVEEAAVDENIEEGADEAGDEPAEEASETESTEADAEEVVEESADDASGEDASDSSAEESAGEGQETSAEESGEEAAAAESADGSFEDASSEAAGDDAAGEAVDSSSEEGSEAQSEGDAPASDSASADEPSDTAADAAAAGSAPDDATGTGDAGATESAGSGEAAASSVVSAEGEAATSDTASPESTAEASNTSGTSSESSSDASQGAPEGSTDSGSSESTSASQTQASTEALTSSSEISTQSTSPATAPSQETTEASSTEALVQPVIQQAQEPPPDNPPEAQPDQVTVVSSEAITLDETILANDVEFDEGQSLEITSVTAPESIGDIDVTEDGTVFTPNAGVLAGLGAGETLSETLEYTVTSGELSDSSTIEITLEGANDAPTVTEPVAISLLEDSGAEGTVVTTVAGSDIDGDTVTYAITSGNELGYFAIDAGTGEVTLTADGATALNNDALTSTSTSIGVTVSDGTLSSNEAPLEITFDAQNDAPTVTEPTAISLLEGSGAEGTVVTTVAGSDIDGDTVTYAITSGNELGYFAIDAGTGEVTLTADGATALNNDALTSTSTSIGVTVSDGVLLSSEASLEIKFDAQNDAPTAGDDTATVIAGGLVTIAAGNGVLANDADVDSSISVESVVLTTPNSDASSITTPGQSVVGQYGTLTLEADGSFAYSANQAESLQLLGGEQVVETFSITVSDGELTDLSTLTITVDGVDDVTVFFGDTAFTIDQEVSSQIFLVQGVLSSFDVDQHAVIAPVEAGQGAYGVFGFQASSDVDGVDGSDPAEPLPNGSVFELPFQAVRPDTPVIDQQTGTVTVGLNYEIDDPNASAPGLVLQIHYDSSVIQNPVLTSNAPGLVQLEDVEDIDNLDFDDATDRMILVAWASPESLDWPGALSGPIASLSFESDFSQAQDAWTTIRFTGVAADGFILDAQSIQIYGDSGLPQQADGTLAAGTWGYTPDPALYRSLADGETVTDEYTFTSSDGQLHPVTVTLVGVNDAPHYQGVYSLPMDSIGTYVFSDQEVTAFDPDDGPTDIVYSVVDAQGGSVFAGGLVVTSFTQDDINNGRVSFVLDSSSPSVNTVRPLLILSVEDGNEDGSEPELLLFNFPDPNASGLQFIEDPTVKINVDQVAVISVLSLLSNDLSSDGGELTISSVDSLSEFGGTVTFNGTDITYTPPAGFIGVDRVFYLIADSTGSTSVASITFEITQAPASDKAESDGEDMIVLDAALPDIREHTNDLGVLLQLEDLNVALAPVDSMTQEGEILPRGFPDSQFAGTGDNILVGATAGQIQWPRFYNERDVLDEPLDRLLDPLNAAAFEDERHETGLFNDEPLVTTVGNNEGQDEAVAGGMGPEVVDEQDLTVAHSFLSGGALVIDPELVAQNELTITNSSQITLTSEFDSGSIQFFPDLLGDGNDWIDFEHDVSSRISAVQTPSPIAETIAGFDVVRLGYQIPLLDIDGVSLDPGHIITS